MAHQEKQSSSFVQMAQETFDSAKDVGTSAYETASRIRHGYTRSLKSYFGEPIRNLSCYLWENLPPFRWLTYTLVALNSIPLVMFLGWGILSFGFVTALAGIGIVISQGFFIFLGLSIFIPVSSFLLVVAGIGATIAAGLWFGLRASNYGLAQLGFMKGGKGYGPKYVTSRGIRDRDANRVSN